MRGRDTTHHRSALHAQPPVPFFLDILFSFKRRIIINYFYYSFLLLASAGLTALYTQVQEHTFRTGITCTFITHIQKYADTMYSNI